MASFDMYSVTKLSPSRYTISARVTDVDAETALPKVIADFTGTNVISFPEVMATLTPQQEQLIVETVARLLVEFKAGLR